MKHYTTGSNSNRDAIKEDTRTDKERYADGEVQRLIPAIKDVLSIDDSWTFQDELDASENRIERLRTCRVWRDRILASESKPGAAAQLRQLASVFRAEKQGYAQAIAENAAACVVSADPTSPLPLTNIVP